MKTRMSRIAAAAMVKGIFLREKVKSKLRSRDGQFAMDNAVVIVIIVVIGGVALTLLTNYLQTDLAATIKSKINEFFN